MRVVLSLILLAAACVPPCAVADDTPPPVRAVRAIAVAAGAGALAGFRGASKRRRLAADDDRRAEGEDQDVAEARAAPMDEDDGEPGVEANSLAASAANAMVVANPADAAACLAPMDVDSPKLLTELSDETWIKTLDYVRKNAVGGNFVAHADDSGSGPRVPWDKEDFVRDWFEGLPPEDALAPAEYATIVTAAEKILHRSLEATAKASPSEGASSGSDAEVALPEELEQLVNRVAAVSAVLTYALISGRDGLVATLWLDGGWLKLHGCHYNTHFYLVLAIEESGSPLAKWLRASFDKLDMPMQWTETATTGRVGYFKELAALCAFTLDRGLAERLCANFRHFVYNPSKRGHGNSMYERDTELLQKYGNEIAGKKLQPLLDVLKAPKFGASTKAGKTNINGERRNAKSHSISESKGYFYVRERSTTRLIARFDSHDKAAGLVAVLDGPIVNVHFRRAVAHIDGLLAPDLGGLAGPAPLSVFCESLHIFPFESWAEGASMMEAAATPALYFYGKVDPSYMQDTIKLAMNQGLLGDYTLHHRFHQLDYNSRNGDNIAIARWLDAYEDVRDDLKTRSLTSISWSPFNVRLEKLVASVRLNLGMERGSSKDVQISADEADDSEEEPVEAPPAETAVAASAGEAPVDASSGGTSVGGGASPISFARPPLPISTEEELRAKLKVAVEKAEREIGADPWLYDGEAWATRLLIENKRLVLRRGEDLSMLIKVRADVKSYWDPAAAGKFYQMLHRVSRDEEVDEDFPTALFLRPDDRSVLAAARNRIAEVEAAETKKREAAAKKEREAWFDPAKARAALEELAELENLEAIHPALLTRHDASVLLAARNRLASAEAALHEADKVVAKAVVKDAEAHLKEVARQKRFADKVVAKAVVKDAEAHLKKVARQKRFAAVSILFRKSLAHTLTSAPAPKPKPKKRLRGEANAAEPAPAPKKNKKAKPPPPAEAEVAAAEEAGATHSFVAPFDLVSGQQIHWPPFDGYRVLVTVRHAAAKGSVVTCPASDFEYERVDSP